MLKLAAFEPFENVTCQDEWGGAGDCAAIPGYCINGTANLQGEIRIEVQSFTAVMSEAIPYVLEILVSPFAPQCSECSAL
jgi:hypothetical protein